MDAIFKEADPESRAPCSSRAKPYRRLSSNGRCTAAFDLVNVCFIKDSLSGCERRIETRDRLLRSPPHRHKNVR